MGSPSGIPVLGDLQPGTHVGQFYSDQRDLLEILVPYFAAGLRQQERCIWVTGHPLAAAHARTALASVVFDLEARERSGQLEIVDYEAWYARYGRLGADAIVQAWLRAEEAAVEAGYHGLRISGTAMQLPADRWHMVVEHATEMNRALPQRRLIALCCYSLAACGDDEVVDVLRNHSISLVRGATGWEVVHGATAALAALDAERRSSQESIEVAYARARDTREQLVRLHRLTASFVEVTTRAQLVELVETTLMPALEADGIAVIERRERDDLVTLVAEGVGAEALCGAVDLAGRRAVWSSTADALVGAPPELCAFAVTPLNAGAHPVGMLVLGYARPRELTASYRALVDDAARQLARALDRARSYEHLEEERERAESGSRAKDEFLAMLGHELRNPLAPILTATQLMRLRDETMCEKERTVIERQVQHMIRLVDDLLDVSRITRGKIELRRRPIEICEVISHAVELTSPAMEERAHVLTIDVPRSGVVVHVDAQRLSQVVSNLLTNAAKYTPHGGRIHLSVEGSEGHVTILVRDSGIGIDRNLLPHVFDLFVQGRQGIDRASGGLGLGLAIARTIVELHGGKIRAMSDGTNRGSVFTVDLPRYANTRPSRTNLSGGFVLPQARARQVLVVDDNEDAAFLFSEALRKLGHTVEVAYDGPSALAVARERPPEIAFLDIGLPVMDGYELGRRLRALADKPPKLVAVTGYGHTSDRARSREAGFDLHLVKPIDLAAVQDALAKLVS